MPQTNEQVVFIAKRPSAIIYTIKYISLSECLNVLRKKKTSHSLLCIFHVSSVKYQGKDWLLWNCESEMKETYKHNTQDSPFLFGCKWFGL